MTLRLLVLDAYPREGRAALREVGATEAGALYRRFLGAIEGAAAIDIGTPADADWGLPEGVALGDYDGLIWTGSSLTVHDDGDDRVLRQIELAREAYRQGVPCFGSCFAAQLAVVAAGGRCARSPRGREFGVSRKILLNDEGRAHPMFAEKAPVFDAFTSHEDEIVELPRDATVLASNGWSRVQAVDVRHERGRFWAVQYHPEYDPHEVAALGRLRAPGLIEQGRFLDVDDASAWSSRMQALGDAPERSDLRFAFAADDDLLLAERRAIEARNWLEQQVRGGRS